MWQLNKLTNSQNKKKHVSPFSIRKKSNIFADHRPKKKYYFFSPFIEISNQQTQKNKHYAKYQNINIFNIKVNKTISFYKDYAKKLPELRKSQTHSWCQIIIL